MSYVHGMCLLSVRLSEDEIASIRSPDKLVLLVPKIAYLTAYYNIVAEHFGDFVACKLGDEKSDALSFTHEWDMKPVKWHHPIGVIVDLQGKHSRDKLSRLDLIVRFREPKKFSDQYLEYRSAELFGSLFLNQIKVALSLRGKGLSQFNILSKEDTDVLQSVATGGCDIDPFLQTFDSIFPSGGVAAVKMYYVEGDEVHGKVMVAPFESEGKPVTVSMVLEQEGLDANLSVVTQGIRLHAETPLKFLQEHCWYADGFIHIVIL